MHLTITVSISLPGMALYLWWRNYTAQASVDPHSTFPVSAGEILAYKIRYRSVLCKSPLTQRSAPKRLL